MGITKPSGGSGSDVQPSSINGNIKINGAETKVYNDAEIKALISSGGLAPYISGKKINAIGDSMTQGKNTGTIGWTDYLQTKYNCTVRNYGVNGSTFTDNSTTFSMSYRWPSMDNDADIIIVWGGFNDINQGKTLGTFTDRVATTYYGALHLMLDGLQTKYTGKKIFIGTILDMQHTWATVKSFNTAIREVAEYWGVPVIELASVGFGSRNASVKESMVPDNVHPNNLGNVFIAEVMAKSINSH
ncbi:SGNH/GDSL hydrolase family protein [Paenibacillus planticolens]|uniref:SGNH hydrolase-type esterase domain-containing protein n=1 Tax=Paenibacillus planticolens TaxID=2654976 RepID=A0ABX1ZMM8_9BACL|nr:SGNH/GDSL hydrolase family protein [Paenibacillus planticolens]NOV01332.1 hypothetical protein [Paenibacillus planticolens]